MRNFTADERTEIRCAYHEAKYKAKQLKILPELYACTQADILAVLGIDRTRRPHNAMPHKSYPPEIRRAAIASVLDGVETYDSAAQKYGIVKRTLQTYCGTERRKARAKENAK